MKGKVTIIGSGHVGSTLAYSLLATETANEVVLIDLDKEKAFGEAMDISQALPFLQPATIYMGDYTDAKGSDIVIITSGLGRRPGQTRIDLASTNVGIMKSIIPQIVKYAPDAFYIIVANPVDVLTYQFITTSGIPAHKVIGSGTILDTARLRAKISEAFSVRQDQIYAHVFGEHGDHSFIPWSMATINSIPLKLYVKSLTSPYAKEHEFSMEAVEEYVRTSGAQIIARKGVTNYGIAASVTRICRCLFSRKETILTVSTLLNGEYGIKDVAMSTMSVVGCNGIMTNIAPPLAENEVQELYEAGNVLKDVIKQVLENNNYN